MMKRYFFNTENQSSLRDSAYSPIRAMGILPKRGFLPSLAKTVPVRVAFASIARHGFHSVEKIAPHHAAVHQTQCCDSYS
jgi:hypothetical protein